MNDQVVGITSTLSFFASAFDKGREALFVDAQSLFHLLIIIEIIFAGLYFAVGQGAELRQVARKILIIGFLSYLITNYTPVLETVLDGFIYAGQRASGASGAGLGLFKDPGRIFVIGCQKINPAFSKLAETSFWDLVSLDPIVVLFCGIVSCLCFGLISIQVFITYLEYLLISALGFILIPFGVFEPLRFLSERVFGAIIGFGIKFMVLGLIVGVAERFVGELTLPATVSWQQALDFTVISLALSFLAFHAPGLALSLLSGSPHISASTVAASAAAGTAVASTLAHGQAVGLAGIARWGLSTVGAAAGGAIAAAQAKGDSKGVLSKALSLSRQAGSGLLGAAAGPIMGAISSVAERAVHGKNGSPAGSKATRADLGINPTQGGVKGALNRGLFSVPAYRACARKKDQEEQKKRELKDNDKGGAQ